MNEDNIIHGEIAIDESVVETNEVTTSNCKVVDGIPTEKYEELYDYYVQFGFDALKRKYSLEITRDIFINNCIKYVEKCPYYGRREENLRICRNMYKEYIENGFEGVVKKFNYKRTRDSLISKFENLLPEYDSKERMRNVEKKNVEFYTKIYNEYKKNGLLNLKEQFGCSNNRKYLLRQFKKYVKEYETVDIDFDDTPNVNGKKRKRSKFWKGFNLKNSSLKEMTDYILEHSDYKTIERDERRIHYLVYMIVNKVNGKIYVGQHETMNIDDNYMGSGSVLELAKRKYGIENFEKIVLFDFKSFEEMNNMEIDIISDDFRRKTDCVYNRCNGGFDGPNSEYQKEMHQLGLWKKPNEGKIMCHDKDFNMKFFFEDEIPEGWVKGGIIDEELHRKLNKLVDELHSLGSNYTWKQGDTVEFVSNMIEQFKKRKAKEELNRKMWREIFDYYKDNGRTKTLEKYKEVEGIVVMDNSFQKYFEDEFEIVRQQWKDDKKSRMEEFEEIKRELQSYGFDRAWDVYNLESIKKMRDACMKRKKWIDDKIKFYSSIIDECYKYGISHVGRKYKDTHIGENFSRFVPLLYKKFMKEKYGKDVEVNENVYSTLSYAKTINRKKREPSDREIERRKKNREERIKLYNELVSLGSKIKYSDTMALTTLRIKIEQFKVSKAKKEAMIKYYVDFYNDIMENGYKSACKKINYTGNLGNLKKRFMKYVDGFKYDDF